MQGEMPAAVLHDELGAVPVSDMVMTPLTDRNLRIQVFAVEQGLPQLQDVGLALEPNAQLLAHIA